MGEKVNSQKTAKNNNLVLIYGDEDYLKKRACNMIVKKTVTAFPEFNYKKFDGVPDIEDLTAAVTNLPMMAEKKCVVIRDAATADFDAESWKKFLEIIKNVPPECVLIIYYDAIKPNQKKKESRFETLIKNVSKLGEVREIKEANNAELNTFINKTVKESGCTIDNKTCDYLISSCGGKMINVKTELSKICALADGSMITTEQIDALTVKPLTSSIFDMAKEVVAGNIDKAMDILDELLFKKEPAIAILYALSTTFCDMFRAKVAYQSGVGAETIKKDFSYIERNNWKVMAALRNSSGVSISFLQNSLEILMKADKELKSTPIDDRVILQKTILDIDRLRKEIGGNKYGSY